MHPPRPCSVLAARWPRRPPIPVATVLAALVAACGRDAPVDPLPPARHCSASAAEGLAFAEVMALPAGRTFGRQWLELVNEGADVACLTGAELQLGTSWRGRRHQLGPAPCVAPGDTVLLGDGDATTRAARLGVAVAYAYGELPLPADVGELTLRCDGRVLTQLRYGTPGDAPAPVGGRSLARQVVAGAPPRWCNVEGPTYDGYDVGSPGRPNPGCALCQDGEVWRPARPPAAGELTLEVFQADPPGPDCGHEWLVVRASAPEAVDLYGLSLVAEVPGRKPRHWQLRARGCTPLAAGTSKRLAVAGRRRLAPPLPFWLGPTLPNRAARWRLLGPDGEVVDEALVPVLPHHAGVRRLGGGGP